MKNRSIISSSSEEVIDAKTPTCKRRIIHVYRSAMQKRGIGKRVLRKNAKRRFSRTPRSKLSAEEICRAFVSKRSHLKNSVQGSKEDVGSQEYWMPIEDNEILDTVGCTTNWTFSPLNESRNYINGFGEVMSVSRGLMIHGEFITFDTGFLIGSETPKYVPVVDMYGGFLGEFNRLDDMLNLPEVF